MRKLLVSISLIPAAFGISAFVFLGYRYVFFDYAVDMDQGCTAFIMMIILILVSVVATIAVDENY